MERYLAAAAKVTDRTDPRLWADRLMNMVEALVEDGLASHVTPRDVAVELPLEIPWGGKIRKQVIALLEESPRWAELQERWLEQYPDHPLAV